MEYIVKANEGFVKLGVSNGAIILPSYADEAKIVETDNAPEGATFIMLIKDFSGIYENITLDKMIACYSCDISLCVKDNIYYLVRG